MKKLMKLFSTKCRFKTVYGDGVMEDEHTTFFPWAGSRIDVKLFGLVWVKCKENNYET